METNKCIHITNSVNKIIIINTEEHKNKLLKITKVNLSNEIVKERGGGGSEHRE